MRLSVTCLICVVLISPFYSLPCASAAPATPGPPAQGDYFMTTAALCADLGSEHAGNTHENVHRGPCNGSVFQRWTIQPDPNRPSRFLVEWFHSGGGGKFWTAEGFHQNADHVTFDPRTDSAFQAWNFEGQSDGSYKIVNDGNAKCVNFNPRGGADLLLTDCGLSGASIVLQPAPAIP